MLSFLCNVFEWIRSLFWKKQLEITIVGLNNAGKSSFVNAITDGQHCTNMQPTVGFNMRTVVKGRVTIKMWDLGGQKRFRGMWERYCRGVHVIVYVVDSADTARLGEATDELHDLLKYDQLRFVPVLVLGNKRDLPESLAENDAIQKMRLNAIENRKVCYYSVSCKSRENLDTVLKCLMSFGKY